MKIDNTTVNGYFPHPFLAGACPGIEKGLFTAFLSMLI
jgi:hypothetical protein